MGSRWCLQHEMMSVRGGFGATNKVVHTPAELMPGQNDYAVAAQALETDIGTDTGYLPIDAATRMFLAERDDVSCLNAVNILLPGTGHATEGASDDG